MRILFVLPYVPSPIRVRPYHFLRQLTRHHDVTVLASAPERDPHAPADAWSTCARTEIVRVRRVASIRSCLAAARDGQPLQSGVCHSPELAGRFQQLLAENEFDVVHVEHLRAARLVEFVPDDVPAIFDSVDCISLLLERTLRSSHSLWQRAIAAVELRRTRAYEAGLLRHYDRIVATSPIDASALEALAPARQVCVIPNGVDLELLQPTQEEREPPTLVFSGKMSYHANVTAALYFVHDILPLVKRRWPAVRLRIVGSQPPRVVQALQRDLSITVTGHVPDLGAALGGATIAVCPVTVKVGVQNKVLEAMALGLPVVSTREGVEGLAAEAGRDLLVGDGPAQFADLVCRLLADNELRLRVGRAGRRFVETRHRWDAAAQQLEAVYADAIEERRLALR